MLVKFFCARPKIYLHIVAVTNILCQTKRWFAFIKIGFCAGTKGFEEALNAVKFLGWLKKFGPAQKILGPVKGQGIRAYCPNIYTVPLRFSRLISGGKSWGITSNWTFSQVTEVGLFQGEQMQPENRNNKYFLVNVQYVLIASVFTWKSRISRFFWKSLY